MSSKKSRLFDLAKLFDEGKIKIPDDFTGVDPVFEELRGIPSRSPLTPPIAKIDLSDPVDPEYLRRLKEALDVGYPSTGIGPASLGGLRSGISWPISPAPPHRYKRTIPEFRTGDIIGILNGRMDLVITQYKAHKVKEYCILIAGIEGSSIRFPFNAPYQDVIELMDQHIYTEEELEFMYPTHLTTYREVSP